ncbi:CKLF-like MARVEL transmembrane domain-containing protein 8 [Culicoides brevitarsis]|uniref:CKLF-like MARVEL transmembrane domain-containing protein 8 n=1 Tax=Culicoides brevitarsis TaxID=469753 RepID=UPI00307C6464
MSHSVVITRTTTTTSGNPGFMYNSGYLKTFPGLLKLAQLILGAICVGIVAWYFRTHYNGTPELFFLLMTTTFLIGTFCLLLSCLVSWSTGGIISKTIYELIYHAVAFLLLLIASIILLVEVTNYRFGSNLKEAYLAASIIGIVNAGLYLISALMANRHYRGL